MVLEPDRIRLCHGPKENSVRPAIDPLFRSAAIYYGPRTVGVVLTGQLDDGTAGLLAIKDRGGTTIVQEPREATAPSMPLSALRHVAIDHRCTISEFAKLLAELAADPEAPPSATADQLLDVEARIASGRLTLEDWRQLGRLGMPSGLNCPECKASLYELSDARVLRFRCPSGHAFSAESLLSAQADAREDVLGSVFSALLEEAMLARRLQQRAEYSTQGAVLASLAGRVGSLEQEAERIQTLLRSMAGLVEPEPAQ
jgi:two-component system chemotaxis response regulator CheB